MRWRTGETSKRWMRKYHIQTRSQALLENNCIRMRNEHRKVNGPKSKWKLKSDSSEGLNVSPLIERGNFRTNTEGIPRAEKINLNWISRESSGNSNHE